MTCLISGRYYSKPPVRVVTEKSNAETSWFGAPLVFETSIIKEKLQQCYEDNGIQNKKLFCR